MFKTNEKGDFDPEIQNNFKFDSKIIKGPINSQNIDSHLYFDENEVKNILKSKFNKKNSLKSVSMDKKVFEEEKQEESFKINEEFNRSYLEMEINSESKSKLEEFDENELLQSLISEEKEQVLKCEISSMNCFDWLIGKRSLLLISYNFLLVL